MSRLRVSRSSYYQPAVQLHARDDQAIQELRAAHLEHPFYGVERLAIHLGWSQHKARRIRTLAGVHIVRPTKKKRYGGSVPAEILAAPNALKKFASFRDSSRPQAGLSYAGMVDSGGWVQDFTYLWYKNCYHYLAVVMDLKTRQVVGWRLGLRHSSELTHEALLDALSKHPSPTILHSDQGTEYLSYKHQLTCERMEITLSCSTRASPWQNGYMERFFGSFKLELGNINRHKELAQLHESVAMTLFYYNTKRIHSALKMSPEAYAATLNLRKDKVSGKVGG